MRNLIIQIGVFGTLVLAVISCKRRELEDRDLIYAKIPISIDWSKSLIDREDIDRVSIYFYPHDGTEPTTFFSEDIDYSLAQLRAGTYSAIIFNEFVTDMRHIFDYQSIKDYESFSASSYIFENFDSRSAYFIPDSTELIRKNHSQLASWSLGEFEVTEEMVKTTRTEAFLKVIEETRSSIKTKSETKTNTDTEADDASTKSSIVRSVPGLSKAIYDALSQFMEVQPLPMTVINQITLEIDNINSAQMIEFIIKGSATGSTFASREKMSSDGVTNVYIDSRKCTPDKPFHTSFITMDPGSETNGVVHHPMITFGADLDAPKDTKYELLINIILHDGTKYNGEGTVRDITEQVNTEEGLINLEFVGDQKITLPEYNGGGFSVGDWGGKYDINL